MTDNRLPRHEGELVLQDVERTYHGITVTVPALVDVETEEVFFNPVVAGALYKLADAAKDFAKVTAEYRKEPRHD